MSLNTVSLRVLFVAPECAPYAKTGGLGDVSASLPAALRRLGMDVRVLIPGYATVLDSLPGATQTARLPAFAGYPEARLLEVRDPSGVPILILDCPPMYRRRGGPYQDEHGADWPDNAVRFGLLSHAAALLATDGCLPRWRADVVHGNDWQTGLAPVYLRLGGTAQAASVMTVHNLAFQGLFPPDRLPLLGLPGETFTAQGVEFYGNVSFLKAGLAYADAITTVSPTYAREICGEPLGFGLQGLLSSRSDVLSGILNGIDTQIWDPSMDPLIACRYDALTLAGKRRNKLALQASMGLDVAAEVPLLGMVSRLTEQKGVDLVLAAARRLIDLPAQLVVVGTGDAEIQIELAKLARECPRHIAVRLVFDERLAHGVEAGADLFLMPSRFEPCGMNQMYSQRYGTPPVVRATGGLADSVVDCSAETLALGTASGFSFRDATPEALLEAVRRAVRLYRDENAWQALQRSAMAKDFGWDASAKRYAEIYLRLATPGDAPA